MGNRPSLIALGLIAAAISLPSTSRSAALHWYEQPTSLRVHTGEKYSLRFEIEPGPEDAAVAGATPEAEARSRPVYFFQRATASDQPRFGAGRAVGRMEFDVPLEVGESATVVHPLVAPGVAGTYHVFACAQPTFSEATPCPRTIELMVYDRTRPDLSIRALDASGLDAVATIAGAGRAKARVFVANLGDATAAATRVELLQLDGPDGDVGRGQVVGRAVTSELAPSTFEEIAIEWRVDGAGSAVYLGACVRGADSVGRDGRSESNRENNCMRLERAVATHVNQGHRYADGMSGRPGPAGAAGASGWR